MTRKTLKAAGETFIYLTSCVARVGWEQWFKTWTIFYYELFTTKPANHVILTLNRLMKNYSKEMNRIDQIRENFSKSKCE